MASLAKLAATVNKKHRSLRNPAMDAMRDKVMRSHQILVRAAPARSAFSSRPLRPPSPCFLPPPRGNAQIARLEAQVATLEAEVATLKTQIARNNKAQMDALAEIKELGRSPNY